ncbi:MAG: TIM barrel protein, partial [Acidimicrobiia bacterium]
MSTIRFGISQLPPETGDDAEFLDSLVEQGHRGLELPFTQGFPWKERRCRSFGELAAERDVRLSVHAPYFAGLTIQDEDKGKQSLAALEHTMKIGKWLGAPVIVAHFGVNYGEDAELTMERIRSRLDYVAPKVESLGVGMGLETTGKASSFGTIGDIAQLAAEFTFVRPVIDWAHVHAMTGGGLTSKDAFKSVLSFIRESFPGWMIQPLQVQFSDNEFGEAGEIRHIPYGEGSLRVGPLVEAAEELAMSMVLISEARDMSSHGLIWDEVQRHTGSADIGEARMVASAPIDFPSPVKATQDGKHFEPSDLDRPIRLSNIDKVFYPDDGYTKGDLIQYYASMAPILLPYLEGRPISMSRYP